MVRRDAVQGPDLALQPLAVDLIDVPQFDKFSPWALTPRLQAIIWVKTAVAFFHAGLDLHVIVIGMPISTGTG